MRFLLTAALSSAILFPQFASSQELTAKEKDKQDWFNGDIEDDSFMGVSANKAYDELLKGKPVAKKVIVAVIDSGVEIDHADLKHAIWTNPNEIPGNGIDDDKNGYIDDVHGWNFLVDADNNDIENENLEATRIMRAVRDGKAEELGISPKVIARAKELYDAKIKSMEMYYNFYVMDSTLRKALGLEEFTYKNVKKLKTKDESLVRIKGIYKRLKKKKVPMTDLVEMGSYSETYMHYYLNMSFDPCPTLTNESRGYGNNNYAGIHSTHGTHVAGIIAGNRENGVGTRGVAGGVSEIMVVRAVPDGDERDIDIALAIRYAVDNGANIINMSFGKGVSPHSHLVHDAIKYAHSKNVLLVHAAGNSGMNLDKVENYPNPLFTKEDVSFLTVGASCHGNDENLPASFSNYGIENVDLFAPGKKIYSTVINQKYRFMNGTSMACPVVAGVAALVWAYNPGLTAMELKTLLMETSRNPEKLMVIQPGDEETEEGNPKQVDFSQLSITGGVINVYDALKAAAARTPGK